MCLLYDMSDLFCWPQFNLCTVHRFILFPLGYLYGVKKKKSNTITVGDPVLEGLFKKNGFVSRNNLEVTYWAEIVFCFFFWLSENLVKKLFAEESTVNVKTICIVKQC